MGLILNKIFSPYSTVHHQHFFCQIENFLRSHNNVHTPFQPVDLVVPLGEGRGPPVVVPAVVVVAAVVVGPAPVGGGRRRRLVPVVVVPVPVVVVVPGGCEGPPVTAVVGVVVAPVGVVAPRRRSLGGPVAVPTAVGATVAVSIPGGTPGAVKPMKMQSFNCKKTQRPSIDFYYLPPPLPRYVPGVFGCGPLLLL